MATNRAPINDDPLKLFEYCVRKALSLGLMDTANTHMAWANHIFEYESQAHRRSELMSIVKREYSQYFNDEMQYCFLEEKIKNNFPYLFGIQEEPNLFERMLFALDAECLEQKNPRVRKAYRVRSCNLMSSYEGGYIYKAQLIVDEGEDPHFSEGMPFDFKTSSASYQCDTVEYDYANAVLFFSIPRMIGSLSDPRVVSDATMNTIALKKLIQQISAETIDDNIPIQKFLNKTTRNLSIIEHEHYPEYLREIIGKDKSQLDAFNAALSKDITFIWGPPGTGKSYTLSAIIMALYKMSGERTAVCCLSNVAVDQLTNKVVDIIEVQEPDMPRGEFYRAGRTQDEKLIATDFLFPDDVVARRLRTEIKLFNIKLEKYKLQNKQYSDEAIKVKAKLKEAREKLKQHTDYLISSVKVVFSTISNFVLNPRLKDAEFDNLIVDEASMLAMPQLIALGRKVKKRIILVGDFQQLSPITMAGVPMLKDSVFKLCGIDINNTDHPALHQLLTQRRSNPGLVEIINHSFYADRLKAENNKNHPIVARSPYSGSVVGMKAVTDGSVRFTRGGTRQNVANAEEVMKLLDMYSKQEEEVFSIGVITPYTGQVSLLKALFLGRGYNIDFQERVRIGTVHTFQGSECDVIIFDMVDCSQFEKGSKAYFGKIYGGTQGEQLLNVAVSRARHKLIVVCDPEYISLCPGDKVSERTRSIFNNLLKAKYTQP